MQQLFNVWTGLDIRRQIIVIGATIAMFFAVISMSKMAAAPSMTLLYSGLESSAAGDVVRSLEQQGVAFEVRGRSIFVDTNERDRLRLVLASEGMPANGNSGYELLDSLSGFGTTSQMFDAAYWRAKEGELARTITSSPNVSHARVHVATTGSNPFQRGVNPKASVSVTPTNAGISSQQAKAIRFLVASAVSGLAPEDVFVIDSNGVLLGAAADDIPAIAGDDKAKVLRQRVERLLDARVGFGNSVVEVSVDTVTESEAIRERSFDPESRVAISVDTEELSNSATDSGGNGVTVASNLPDENAGGSGDSSSKNSETRERINYEISETEREIIRTPGAIRRLTVAVLVNDVTSLDENQIEIQSPRSQEELETLRELVSSAVGFDGDRGDVITIKSMALQPVIPVGTDPTDSLFDRINIDVMSAIQMVILAIVTLILGLFVIRPLLSKSPAGASPNLLVSADQQRDNQFLENRDSLTSNSGETQTGEVLNEGEQPVSQVTGELPNQSMTPAMSADPVQRLQSMIGDRQEETVEILRSWLEEKEENA